MSHIIYPLELDLLSARIYGKLLIFLIRVVIYRSEFIAKSENSSGKTRSKYCFFFTL